VEQHLNYGLDIWGDDNFFIDKDVIKLNYGSKPSLLSIVKEIRGDGHRGPLLLRFPHITQKQIDILHSTFNSSIKENNYKGNFNAVFPLKVNQFPNFVLPLVQNSKKHNYGLEAGSKAELILALAYNNNGAPITVNGFKDKEMIILGFIAVKMGFNITITLEGLNELDTIIEVFNEFDKKYCPNIGLRVRLHSSGSGVWAKSGGIDSKFGLSSTEILEAYETLKEHDMTKYLYMIHFHIGSAMTSIKPLKKALKESGHIYAELVNMGADMLTNINIGGGLGIEYSRFQKEKQYSLEEFSNDVVFTLKEIARQKGVKEPNIFTESGRFIAAPGTVLVTPVLELFSSEYELENLRLKSLQEDNYFTDPPLIQELYDLYNSITSKNAREYMHDALDHLESLLTLFSLGYIDLQDRSNAEVLTHLIIKKTISLLTIEDYTELKKIDEKIQERYLLNFSIFQSLPDFWGIDQEFPVMPISHLDQKATRSATLWDITCDSDGEIPFNPKKPLYLHDINLKTEEYFLGFFLVGAYQDTLGMKHNLFASPSEINIEFDGEKMVYKDFLPSQNIHDILEDLDYGMKNVQDRLFSKLEDKTLLEKLKEILYDTGYLKIGIK
jgi:arginine decarboxylase